MNFSCRGCPCFVEFIVYVPMSSNLDLYHWIFKKVRFDLQNSPQNIAIEISHPL